MDPSSGAQVFRAAYFCTCTSCTASIGRYCALGALIPVALSRVQDRRCETASIMQSWGVTMYLQVYLGLGKRVAHDKSLTPLRKRVRSVDYADQPRFSRRVPSCRWQARQVDSKPAGTSSKVRMNKNRPQEVRLKGRRPVFSGRQVESLALVCLPRTKYLASEAVSGQLTVTRGPRRRSAVRCLPHAPWGGTERLSRPNAGLHEVRFPAMASIGVHQ